MVFKKRLSAGIIKAAQMCVKRYKEESKDDRLFYEAARGTRPRAWSATVAAAALPVFLFSEGVAGWYSVSYTRT